MNLTQKERDLLKDLKNQEQLCIEKYAKHSQTAVDGQLKNLFDMISKIENSHLSALVQIENGSCPQLNADNMASVSFTGLFLRVAGDDDRGNDVCQDTAAAQGAEQHPCQTHNGGVNAEILRDSAADALNHPVLVGFI